MFYLFFILDQSSKLLFEKQKKISHFFKIINFDFYYHQNLYKLKLRFHKFAFINIH